MRRSRLASSVTGLVLVAHGLGWVPAAAADVPIAVDDSFVVQASSNGNNLLVLANDTVSGAAQITDVSTPDAGGFVQIVGSGRRIGYSPADGYAGPETFQYTVTDPVDGDATATVTIKVNAPPVALDDPSSPLCNPSPTAFGGSFPIVEDYGQFVLGGTCGPSANDSDPDGSIVSWAVDTLPAHGTLDWLSGVPGFVGYTPDADFSTAEGDWVSDSFSYHVIDDDGASSNTATYRIWLAPVNDPPSFSPGPLTISSPENTPYSQAWASDPSPGPANESDQAVHYVISDEPGNDLSIFSTPPAIADDGVLSFVPAADRTGTVHLTVVAQDDGGLNDWGGNVGGDPPDDTSDPVTLTITIDDVNQPPVAVDDTLTVTEDQPAGSTVLVLANDSDPDADPLTIASATNGAKGTVTIAGDALSVVYKPNANASGSDSFTYTIDDGRGGTDSATVDVTITAVNDPPNAVNDPGPYTVYLKAPALAIPVLANDTSLPDAAETLLITSVTQGSHGTVTIAGGGTGLTYVATGSTLGLDVFTYTISDGHGGVDTASVQVTVAADSTPPVAAITAIARNAVSGRPASIRLTVRWTLTDTGSGLAGQLLQRRTDGGAWVTVALPSLSARSISLVLPRGHTDSFRVRGTDRAGNVGAFATRSIGV